MGDPARFDNPPHSEAEVMPGLYNFGLDDDKRRALNFRRELFSYSKLSRFANPDKKISPFVAGVGNLVSDTLLFGASAVMGHYAFAPEQWKKNEREGKRLFNEYAAEHPGMTIIRPKERAEAARLVGYARASKDCSAALEAPGLCEVGVVAELDGVTFRSWLDKLTKKAIIDVKTTRMENSAQFLDAMLRYKYDVQASLYMDQCEAIGMGQLPFYWLIISKTANRAWMQPLPAWGYQSGKRWRVDMANAYLRQDSQRLQIDLLTKLNQVEHGITPQPEGDAE